MLLRPVWVEQVPSTNTELLRRIRAGERVPRGFVLAAREQTAGRGRFGRSWVMTPGRDLAFSLLIGGRGSGSAGADPTATLTAALGIAEGLASLGVRCRVKWPNDVLGTRGKMAGILAEVATRPDGRPEGVVLGIGVNLALSSKEAQAFDPPATSLLLECGRVVSPEAALDRLLPALDHILERWHVHGFRLLREAWLSRCAWLGERVILRDESRIWIGRFRGVGVEGQLLLELEDGSVQAFWSGDLRVAENDARSASPCGHRPDRSTP